MAWLRADHGTGDGRGSTGHVKQPGYQWQPLGCQHWWYANISIFQYVREPLQEIMKVVNIRNTRPEVSERYQQKLIKFCQAADRDLRFDIETILQTVLFVKSFAQGVMVFVYETPYRDSKLTSHRPIYSSPMTGPTLSKSFKLNKDRRLAYN